MEDSLFNINKRYYKRKLLEQEGCDSITYENIENLLPEEIKRKIYRKVVLCICTQTASCIAGFLALEQSDGIPLMIGQTSTEEYIKQNLILYRINYLWIPQKIYEKNVWTSSYSVVFCFRDYILAEKIEITEETYIPHIDLALLLATSGSTGEQKLVRLSKKNIRYSVELIELITGFNQDDVGLVYLPVEHCFTIGLIHALYNTGASLVCAPHGLMDLGRLGFIDQYNVSVLISVTFIIDFLRKTDFFEVEHPKLRIIANGAGATPKETQDFLSRYMRRQGGRLIPTYGQTEVTIVASALPEEALSHVYNSIGIPYGDIEMTIDNVDSEGVGELVIKSSAVMLGYATKGEDLLLGNTTHNILHTGDLVVKDEEGFFYIKGRLARFAKINGNRISLQSIEEQLSHLYQEVEFACVSNDRDVRILATATEEECREIENKLAKITGLNKCLLKCYSISSIPRNETGKIQYYIVKNMLYERELYENR